MLEASWLEGQLLRRTSGHGVEANVRQDLILPQPRLATIVRLDYSRSVVCKPGAEAPVEDVWGFDDMIIDRENRRPSISWLWLRHVG